MLAVPKSRPHRKQVTDCGLDSYSRVLDPLPYEFSTPGLYADLLSELNGWLLPALKSVLLLFPYGRSSAFPIGLLGVNVSSDVPACFKSDDLMGGDLLAPISGSKKFP